MQNSMDASVTEWWNLRQTHFVIPLSSTMLVGHTNRQSGFSFPASTYTSMKLCMCFVYTIFQDIYNQSYNGDSWQPLKFRKEQPWLDHNQFSRVLYSIRAIVSADLIRTCVCMCFNQLKGWHLLRIQHTEPQLRFSREIICWPSNDVNNLMTDVSGRNYSCSDSGAWCNRVGFAGCLTE